VANKASVANESKANEAIVVNEAIAADKTN
jgi:hypothetical protein